MRLLFQMLLTVLPALAAYSQHQSSLLPLTSSPAYTREAVKSRQQKIGLTGYFGFAAGKESFLSIMPPKLGVLAYASLNRNEPVTNFSFPRKTVYAGMDIGAGVLIASYAFGAVLLGIKYGYVTIDNSLAIRSSFIKPDTGVKNNLVTYNPKIGFQYKQIWLKAGPSFVVKDGLSHTNWMRWGSTYFNVDLNYLIKRKSRSYAINKIGLCPGNCFSVYPVSVRAVSDSVVTIIFHKRSIALKKKDKKKLDAFVAAHSDKKLAIHSIENISFLGVHFQWERTEAVRLYLISKGIKERNIMLFEVDYDTNLTNTVRIREALESEAGPHAIQPYFPQLHGQNPRKLYRRLKKWAP